MGLSFGMSGLNATWDAGWRILASLPPELRFQMKDIMAERPVDTTRNGSRAAKGPNLGWLVSICESSMTPFEVVAPTLVDSFNLASLGTTRKLICRMCRASCHLRSQGAHNHADAHNTEHHRGAHLGNPMTTPHGDKREQVPAVTRKYACRLLIASPRRQTY